jgi:signal transduction histidine kinase
MEQYDNTQSLKEKIISLEEELNFKDREVESLKGAFLANVSHEIRTPMNEPNDSIHRRTNLMRYIS